MVRVLHIFHSGQVFISKQNDKCHTPQRQLEFLIGPLRLLGRLQMKTPGNAYCVTQNATKRFPNLADELTNILRDSMEEVNVHDHNINFPR